MSKPPSFPAELRTATPPSIVGAHSDSERKSIWRKVYDFVATLDSEGFELMNFGFADGALPASNQEPDPDRFARQMYASLLNQTEIRDRSLLEVGCGRGGGACFASHHFAPRRVLAVDFSPEAILVCRRRYGSEAGLEFRVGDAECLPVADGEFDIVVNVESSHCYDSRPRFYSEVRRVLRPGGEFLYADHFQAPSPADAELEAAGFIVIERREITAEVLRVLEITSARKTQMLAAILEPRRGLLENWAGVVGSPIFEALHSGRRTYLRYRLRTTAA